MTRFAGPSVGASLRVLAVEWGDLDAAVLRAEMAAEVGPRYANLSQVVRAEANAVDPATVHRTFVAYAREPVGHAAIRWNGDDLEVKRMFVRPAHRGGGAATLLLSAAEDAAREQGRSRIILQTGHLQPAAVRFYERSGYQRIPIFHPYAGLPLSNCFEKKLG